MDDDIKDATVQEPQGTEQDEQPTTETPADEKPAEKGDQPDELATWKGYARKHEDRAKALASENEALKTQLEAANDSAGRVSDLEAAVSAAEKRAERAEIAAEVSASKGVKLRYLSGETREELEAAADTWLEDAKAVHSRVGVVPTQGTGDPAPRVSSYESGAERARAQSDHSKKEGR